MIGITSLRLRWLSPRVEVNVPRILAAIVLALGAALFVQRGIIRGLSDAGDFGTPYAQAGAWLRGDNPYDISSISRAFSAAGADADDYKTVAASFPAYPPSTLPLMAPISVLPWSLARIVWVALLGVLTVVGGLCCVWLCGRSVLSTHGLMALGLIMALAPLETGLAKGNLSVASAVISLIGVLLIQRRAAMAGGVLLGLGLALKPQEAIGFLVFAIVMRRWRAVAGAAVVAMVCWSVGVVALGSRVPDWTTTWADSIARSMAPGAINDPSSANANRDQVITLARLLTDFTPSMELTQVLAVPAVSGTGLLVVVGVWRSRAAWKDVSGIWPLSALLVLSMLATYHRFYDACVLALPVAAVVAQASYPGSRIRVAMAVALACFYVPGGAMLLIADQSGWIPATVQQSSVWVSGVRAHEVLALCLLAVLFTIMTWRMIPSARVTQRVLSGDVIV